MFELLLQADKSMAAGLLDQAEKTYWQLVELDPTNAIAVAGLARVSLERGDERSARTFAEQALGIDPDSIAARRVIERVEHRAGDEAGAALDALPLVAVERLEALSRRRSADSHADDPGPVEGKAGTAKSGSGATETSGEKAAPARGGSRDRTRPDQVDPLPVEPLPERRKAGRLAAAAAAAAAAAREPVRARHEPHHAMPIGRRFFDPGLLKAAAADEFSAAEMAAAVAAIDDVDENAGAETADAAAMAEPQASGTADVLGAVDATEADESVALRLALLGNLDELEAGEVVAQSQAGGEPAEAGPGEFDDEFEAAEAVARSQAGPVLEAEPGEFDDEFEAAEAVARSQAGPESNARRVTPEDTLMLADAEAGDVAVVEPAPDEEAMAAADEDTVPPHEAAAAEAEAAAEADFEFLLSAEPAELRTAPALPPVERLAEEGPSEEGPSEEEAEAQALREAMDIVLAGESAAAAGSVAADGGPEHSTSTEPGSQAPPSEGLGSDAASPAPADPGRTTSKRRGFFRRNKGS